MTEFDEFKYFLEQLEERNLETRHRITLTFQNKDGEEIAKTLIVAPIDLVTQMRTGYELLRFEETAAKREEIRKYLRGEEE